MTREAQEGVVEGICKKHAEALDAIADRSGGCLHPEEIVREASKKSSPLHDAFEWDDSIAAHQHRLEQARGLVQSYKITILSRDTKRASVTVRKYHSLECDRGAEGMGYRPIHEILSDGMFTDRLLSQAKRELRSIREKYAALSGLAGVWEKIDQL